MPFCFALCRLAAVASAAHDTRILTRIADVHSLSVQQANEKHIVRVRGIVTQNMPGWNGFALQEGQDAIYVALGDSGVPLPPTGHLVEVRGRSNGGNFAPLIFVEAIQDLGSRPFPEAPLVNWPYLASGACDNRYIEIDGIVRSAGAPQSPRWRWAGTALHLEVEGNLLWAYVRDFTGLDAPTLTGAHIRLHGTCVVLSNSRRQFERNMLLVRAASDIRVLNPAPRDPFTLPVSPMDRLFSYKSGRGFEPGQVRVQGTVTWAEGVRLFIQNGDNALQVLTAAPVSVHAGDCFEVVGFPAPGTYAAVLQDSILRQCSSRQSIAPHPVTASAILSRAETKQAFSDGLLVHIKGTLLDTSESAKEEVLTVQDADIIYTARLSGRRRNRAGIAEGSRIALTGICLVQVDDLGSPRAFEVLLRSPADITLVAAPSWLTRSLALRISGALFVAACAALLWIVFLRVRIRTQSLTIEKEVKRGAALEKRLRQLIEHAGDMVYLLDAEGTLLHVNEGTERLTGYPRSELLGRSVFDFIVPEQRQLARQTLQANTRQSQSNFELAEWRFLRKDGHPFDVEINQRVEIGPDRKVRIEAIGRDVTARRKLMFEYQERFRTLADNIPQLAWIADAAGSIVWLNQRWFEYTGATPESSRGWAWLNYHHPDHVERVVNRLRHSFDTSESWEDTFPLRGVDGQFRWFLGRAVPIRDANGQLVSWFGTNTDITDQKQTEADLQRSNNDLTQFAYIASHDLQEPLRNIGSFAQLLARTFGPNDLTPQRSKFLDVIASSIQRMDALIQDLLAYSRATGSQITDCTETCLQSVLDVAIENLQTSIRQSHVQITHDPLPAVCVNAVHFTQVFQNLLGNSIKYARPGVPPKIHIGARQQMDDWLLYVEDNGSGFAAEYAERVFGIFKRLHNRDIPGTGIGLSICKAIVERHGGRIWAEGRPGLGATFYFTIPHSGSAATLDRTPKPVAASSAL